MSMGADAGQVYVNGILQGSPGGGLIQVFSKLNLASSTFSDDIPDTLNGIIFPPISLGAINTEMLINIINISMAANITALTLGAALSFVIASRDLNQQSSTSLHDISNASGGLYGYLQFGINGTGITASNGGFNQTGYLPVGGTDSYGNAVSQGDEIVLDVAFYFDALGANQTGTVSGVIQFVIGSI
jgi:hypothetical protein